MSIIDYANIASSIFGLIGLILAVWAIFISKKQLQLSLDETNKQLAEVSKIISQIQVNQTITNNHKYEYYDQSKNHSEVNQKTKDQSILLNHSNNNDVKNETYNAPKNKIENSNFPNANF